ncbi:MAG TPA: hypothetical protein VFQ00_06230 [Terriglobales bacterium]|nr:hypothetical protein [Terriglobales bacterium]
MIIFDSSTLILTSKTELLEPFLGSIGLEVAIPAEVARECCGAKKTMDALRIQRALDDSRIEIITVANGRLVSKLQADFSLGRGEAEVIALALKTNAQLVAIDDKNGINACKFLGLAFTTAIGILLRSYHRGMLDRDNALATLKNLTAFGRYADAIVEDARLKLKERL